MDRRTALKLLSVLGISHLYRNSLFGLTGFSIPEMTRSDFGLDFKWGVSTSAYQIEGGYNIDGKGLSIWDIFTHEEGNIKKNATGDVSCDFYHKYKEDIQILKLLNFDCFRFSLSWSRILPTGVKQINQKGVDFYHRVIDECLINGIEPWITLYHWDLPDELQKRGGWTNREILQWFCDYVDICTREFGQKVKNWMILNEPLAFTLVGYMLGVHAPGRMRINDFISAVHHAALCNSEGARIVRKNVKGSKIGTTFSCSMVEPLDLDEKNINASQKFDALLNRLFIEPTVGLGYPIKELPFLCRIEKYIKTGDLEKLPFDFDFIGIQNYTREVVRFAKIVPFINAFPIKPKRRGIREITEMGWEIYPKGLYEILKKFAKYNPKEIIVTENGAAFPDILIEGKIHDIHRKKFFQDYLSELLRAKKEGINVTGYFVWSLMDNFEWAEGYRPRFGLVYVDFKNNKRYIKDSGYWFQNFLHF